MAGREGDTRSALEPDVLGALVPMYRYLPIMENDSI